MQNIVAFKILKHNISCFSFVSTKGRLFFETAIKSTLSAEGIKAMIHSITKRDGRIVLYDQQKIASAILKAMEASGEGNAADAARVANDVQRSLEIKFDGDAPDIEAIQDTVEQQLMNHGFSASAKAYILYRANRTRARESSTSLMKTIDEITQVDARKSDMKRENANIDGNTAMGSMLQIGAAGRQGL